MRKNTLSSQTIVEFFPKGTKKKRYVIGKNKKVTIVLLLQGNTSVHADIILSGEHAEAQILGVVVGSHSDEIHLTTLQHHKAEHTISDLNVKSVLQESAVFSYDGMIRVDKHAQHTNAYQRNDNLLLSPTAQAITKPALEILANDVRCTHGATIGQVDHEQLFYLTSRGISRNVATKLIVSGFLARVLDKIEDEKARRKVTHVVAGLSKIKN